MFENYPSHLRDQRRPTNCDLSKGVRVVQTLGEEPSELCCLRQGSLIVAEAIKSADEEYAKFLRDAVARRP